MKIIKKLSLLFFIPLAFACSSCKEKNKTSFSAEELKAKQEKSSVHTDDLDSDTDFTNSEEESFLADGDFSQKAFVSEAHKKYLNDTVDFKPFETQNVESENLVVVGSDLCKLYPESSFTIKDGKAGLLDENMSGTPVPLGTILELTGSRLYSTDSSYDGMFNFEDNWNFFYPVIYQGKKGYVYGADLYKPGLDAEKVRIAAELYNTNGALTSFHPYVGYTKLDESVQDELKKNYLAIQETKSHSSVDPDDMVQRYEELAQKKDMTVFFTTDFAAHCQHLIFDRMLQYTEEKYFFPRLLSLTDDMIAALENVSDIDSEVKERAIGYFQVPKILMELAPETVETGDYASPIAYKEKVFSAEKYASYPEAVVQDVKQVLNAEGSTSAVFDSDEQFSQYRPRGHYTKNGVLESYFRAEMWYGRIHFLIASAEDDASVESKSLEMLKSALFIIDTVHKNPVLYEKWQEVFNPITDLIGLSDDLSFDDIIPLWKKENSSDFNSYISDEKNLRTFIALCHQKLKPPAISGNSLLYGAHEASKENPRPPMGWRFLGQRFTYDSYIHSEVSAPRIKRPDVMGLDVMKAFGSAVADKLLEGDYGRFEKLKASLDELEKIFASFDSSFWSKTYYNLVLLQIKNQACFGQGSGYFFTKGALWNVKSLLASHGTWAELRHDTILYVKQSYAEMGGGDDMEPTYRVKPLPDPVNYVEPNIPFWQGSLAAVDKLISVYKKYDLLDKESENALTGLQEVYSKALEIALAEKEDAPISSEQNSWIRTACYTLGRLIMVHVEGNYFDDPDQLKMACIADVYTNAEENTCLEVAVGIPNRIYVPLNDGQGGKRIAVGYGFSYYEFKQSADDRLTDEKWKKMVYSQEQDVKSLRPFWEQGCILSDGSLFN